MTNAVLGNIVATAGTIAGVVLGYLLSGAQARGARRGELRSLLDATRWELSDARMCADTEKAPLPIPLPTLELVVQRGMLGELPVPLRQRLLQTRTFVTLHNERREVLLRFVTQVPSSAGEVVRQLADQAKDARRVLPLLDSCLAALEDHLNGLGAGWPRRLWNRPWRRKTTGGTPRP